ncbi:MAG: ECF transporter S component [Oscillospiraceae bacterium]|nr:ECF transporter S component [Oscillospiraceae bacterium]
MNTSDKTKAIVILGMLTAISMLFSFTPIGSIPVGPLVITLNTIPLAIGAIALGPIGGLVIGSVFGLLSFLQCINIGVTSPMGVILYDINPFLAFVQRFVPRALDGLLIGLMHRALEKKIGGRTSSFVTGFFAAFLNTVFFMSALILLFGNTPYMQEKINGQNIIVFVCTFVGINAVAEMILTTVVCGGVGTALYQARILPLHLKRKKS